MSKIGEEIEWGLPVALALLGQQRDFHFCINARDATTNKTLVKQ